MPPSPSLPRLALHVDGDCIESGSGVRPILNPATGEVVARVPDATAEQVAQAVAAARRAFDSGSWPRSRPQQRALVLQKAASLIERDREQLAELETLDTGKTLAESRLDMVQIAAVFRYYASLVSVETGDVNPVPAEALSLTLHEPVGVVAAITPWNYPLLQASWKIAPALAAGCTMVLKPSELTPLTTLRCAELLAEAGVPSGVLNVVLGGGRDVGAPLVEHPDVDMISFTGGIATGRVVARAAAEGVKRVALELGGKNPNVVFADADLDAAADHALNAVFYHAGQVCSAGARLLLQDGIHDAFVERIVARAERIRLGFGWEEDTEMGPLISAEHRDKVEGYIRIAREEGGTVRLGGGRPSGEKFANGFFVEPTIVTGVTAGMRIAREEVFGPVLTVERFGDEEEAVRLGNDTPTGLAAGVWSSNVPRAIRVGRALRFGTVWLNDFHPYYPEAPWGGYKQSGVGRELGRTGLREFQEEKHLYLNLEVGPAEWFGRSGDSR